jgi:hypothetical protein
VSKIRYSFRINIFSFFSRLRTITCEQATGLVGDILVTQYTITYPDLCFGFCRTRFKKNLLNSLRKGYEKFTVSINFTIAGIKTVTLEFCGVFGTGQSLREIKIKS